MSKYIYNISGEAKTYQGIEIANNAFYQIPANLLTEYQNEANLLSDLLSGLVRMSSDGIAAYSTNALNNLNFLRNEQYEVDSEGRQIIRTAAGKAGWTYLCHPIEFETAKFSSLYSKKHDNTDRGDVTIKFYDSNNSEITTPGLLNVNEASITKTVVRWSPDYDYEIVSGSIRQVSAPNTDVRVWTIGGIIELGGAYVKEFSGGLNLRYMGADEELRTDGRASKYMKKTVEGVPYNANQFEFIIRHNAGVQHKIMILLEYFRA